MSIIGQNEISSVYNELVNKADDKVKQWSSGSASKSIATGNMKVTEYFDVKKLLSTISEYDVLVGIPDDGSERKTGPNGEPITNAELAYIHTHGVDKNVVRNNITTFRQQGMNFSGARKAAQQLYIASHGSPAHRIPPRPIIEPAIEANQDEIENKLEKALSAFLDFNFILGEKKLKAVGMFAQNKVRGWFTDSRNGWPPNSPATIKAKSKGKNIKDNPLIDTGELRKSITYVVKTPNTKFARKVKVSNILNSKMKTKEKLSKIRDTIQF